MTNEEIKKLTNSAIITARALGFREYEEDIAQEVLLMFLSGKGKHQAAKQCAIDVIRKWTKHTSRNKATRQQAKNFYLASSFNLTKRGGRVFQGAHDFGDLEKIISLASLGYRKALLEYFKNDKTQTQIAKELGITHGGVYLQIEKGLKQIRRRKGCFT